MKSRALERMQSLSMNVVGFGAVATSCTMVGGLVVSAKTGTPPDNWLWTYVPAVGAGIVAVLCNGMIASRAVTDFTMPNWMRMGLGCLWLFQFVSMCVTLPIYLLGCSLKVGVPETVAWIQANKAVGYTTLVIYGAIVATLELGWPGLLITVFHEKKKAVVEAITSAGLDEIQTAVIRNLTGQLTGVTKKTIKQLLADDGFNLEPDEYGPAVDTLVRAGRVTKQGHGKGALYMLEGGGSSG